jgi:hypothetical protein
MSLLEELIKAMPEDDKKLNADAPEFIPFNILKHSDDTGLSVNAIKMLLEYKRIKEAIKCK